MRVGLIARSDYTGLGIQTRNLARMLNPDRVLLINSTIFNGNQQHPEIYTKYNTTEVEGFPGEIEIRKWIEGLDVVISCEIFYNTHFVDIANFMGVKTILQYNWEFADYLRHPEMTLPTSMVSPSYWHLHDAQALWGNVSYLPTPMFLEDYEEVKEYNLNRTGQKRFLHVMGRQAVNDRNGTNDLIKALKHSYADFELVIKAQSGNLDFLGKDPRLTIDTSSPANEVELYRDFDAMILPRKYAGQCLPMTEALCAGLPVIMTDIEPNNQVLPPHWLVESEPIGQFMARTMIDMYAAVPHKLADRLEQFAEKDLRQDKLKAYNIGKTQYSSESLETKWRELIEITCSR